MTVATILLRNGTQVSVNFGNNDGTISQAEIDDAVARLEARMGSPEMPGTEFIDHDARIRITEGSATVERSADVLVRNGAVRLFGNNPMRSNSTGTLDSNPAMWHPTAVEVWPGGDRHTIYREVDRWDPAAGQVVPGRTVRVTEDGSRYILNDAGAWRIGTAADHIPVMPFLAAADVDGLSGADVARMNARGTGSGEFVKVEIGAASLPPSPAVPGGIVMTDDWLFHTFNLTPANQQRDGGRAYDVYTSTGPGGSPVAFRRPHGGGAWESGASVNGPWAAAAGIVSPEMAAVVRGTPEGWRIEYRPEHTVFLENVATNPRSIRVSNATGAVEVMTGPDAYRAATPEDHLPAFPHFVAPGAPGAPAAVPTSLTLQMAPGAAGRRTVALTPMPQATENGVVYDVFRGTAEGMPADTYFRRRHDGTGGWEFSSNSSVYAALPAGMLVDTAAPAVAPVRPRAPGGSGGPRRAPAANPFRPTSW